MLKVKSKREAYHVFVAAMAICIVLWFIQGFYFLLNDTTYGKTGIGISLLMLAEVITMVIGGFSSMFYIDEVMEE